MKRWVYNELRSKTMNLLFVYMIIVVKPAWQGLTGVGKGGGDRKTIKSSLVFDFSLLPSYQLW